MIKKMWCISCLVIVAALVSGCSTNPLQNSSGSKGQSLTVAIALPPSIYDSVSKAVAVISAPDMDSISQQLSIDKTNGVFGTVEKIPLGYHRYIEVKLFDKHNVMTYFGDATTDVLSDKAVNVTITLKPIKGTVIINGTIDNSDQIVSPFVKDSGTVFLANFNGNLNDSVTGTAGTLAGGDFVNSIFGKGIKFTTSSISSTKAIYRFPASNAINLTTGTMEAFFYTDSVTSDFTHIIDKSWLYGITAYNGELAVNFGSGWWYSSIPLPVKKWSYVCGSFDGKTIRLYLNGVLVASSTYSGFNGDASYELGIGNAAADSHNVPFHGIIDEIRISKTVRSDSEIAKTWAGIKTSLE